MIRTRSTAADVRRSVMDLDNGLIDCSLSRKTVETNCHNCYHSASGRNVVTWRWRESVYLLVTRLGGIALTTRRAAEEKRRAHLEPGRAADRSRLSFHPGPPKESPGCGKPPPIDPVCESGQRRRRHERALAVPAAICDVCLRITWLSHPPRNE